MEVLEPFRSGDEVYDIVNGRAVARRSGRWAPVAYVRETWPILRSIRWRSGDVEGGPWDGSYIQVVIDCPLCGEQHRHGGYVSDERLQGHRGAHCHSRSVSHARDELRIGGYFVYDARRYRVVSRLRTQQTEYAGPWPGDRDPRVDEAEWVVRRGNLGQARRMLGDDSLPPAAVRLLYEGMGAGARAKVSIAKAAALHPLAPDDVLSDIADSGPESAQRYLASNPRLPVSLANQLTGSRTHATPVHYALANNPAITPDTLGWLTEVATGFRGYGIEGRDPRFGRLLLGHPNVDREVLGFLAAIPELAAQVLQHPACDHEVAYSVFEAGIESFDETAQMAYARSKYFDSYTASRLMSEGREAAADHAKRAIAERWPHEIDFLDLDDWAEGAVRALVANPAAPQPASPGRPTLYRHFDSGGQLLYVGRTIRPVFQRQHEHLKTKTWWNEVAESKYERFDSEQELAEAEVAAIKNERPLYNLIHNGPGGRT